MIITVLLNVILEYRLSSISKWPACRTSGYIECGVKVYLYICVVRY